MEEKEQLRRQIRLLQGLINDHKNVHGNAPVPLPSTTPRWRNPCPPTFSSRGAFSARYSQQAPMDFQQHHGNSWRKKYSLVNRPPGPTSLSGSGLSASSSQASVSHRSCQPLGSQPAALERHVGLTTDGNIVVGIKLPQRTSAASDNRSIGEPGSLRGLSGLKEAGAAAEGAKRLRGFSYSQNIDEETSLPVSHCSVHPAPVTSSRGDANPAYLTGKGKMRTTKLLGDVTKSASELCRTISESAIALKSKLLQPSALPDREAGWLSSGKKSEPQIPARFSSEQVGAGRDDLKEPKIFGHSEAFTSYAQAATSEAGAGPAKIKFVMPHKTPSLQRAVSPAASSKTLKFRKTNYTWVANPGKCPRVMRRWTSPKAPESGKKLAFSAERAVKLLPKGDLGAKQKKSGLHSKPNASPSKYKWKASSLQSSPSTSKSTFTWQSGSQQDPGVSRLPRADSGLQTLNNASVSHGGLKPPFNDAAFSTYKVKSRTKIIRRKGSSGSPVDKKNSSSPTMPLKSPSYLRKRTSLRGKPSPMLKRTSPKGRLVQLTKHRLCRLPASRTHVPAKEGSSLHLVRSPPANKVIKTRYRIVKKNVASPSGSLSSFSDPIPSWKTRRLAGSRSLVLNRMRQSPQGGKSPQLQQRWRNKGYRCIGGVMYRVSANKLSKTSSPPDRGSDLSNKIHVKPARLDCTPSGPGHSPPSCLNRSATSRYIASRAVQRSLAIIRQAKQKKEKKKEYCMYYNRFGKCNRGDSCPYIHDPEKVAVCTRFLRGTCKKTDGTCSFSHQVSKDKMPVCSYFLKGICNNSNCPYSHVYVSRKAEVCPDFLKGYCPRGEKCKKKHTLVCPDFAKKGVCPKGARCKLQHPQKRRGRHAPSSGDLDRGSSPPKWRRLGEQTLRREAAWVHDDGEVPGPSRAEQEVKFWSDTEAPGTSRLQKLPSFISLLSSSSPSDEARRPERDKAGEDTASECLHVTLGTAAEPLVASWRVWHQS
ncbi:zinc finger CCCH domain-containing protein 3 isoform X1 [Alligator mississippiensis]|uniref:zinc finger CCCH domain-containing protein 3 isoform X1 n=2 Tax=Alligator mississippiensis TaxID=8496 RepID=UPI00287742ED|nr:zinc finger CCCH domain-containing protein 3 isoform X1 [Alligator mississippiensis]